MTLLVQINLTDPLARKALKLYSWRQELIPCQQVQLSSERKVLFQIPVLFQKPLVEILFVFITLDLWNGIECAHDILGQL